MWTKHPARELARARLDIPNTSGRACETAVFAIEASIRSHSDGELVVTLRTEPGGRVLTLPLLAYLQFMNKFEDAVSEGLTNQRRFEPAPEFPHILADTVDVLRGEATPALHAKATAMRLSIMAVLPEEPAMTTEERVKVHHVRPGAGRLAAVQHAREVGPLPHRALPGRDRSQLVRLRPYPAALDALLPHGRPVRLGRAAPARVRRAHGRPDRRARRDHRQESAAAREVRPLGTRGQRSHHRRKCEGDEARPRPERLHGTEIPA